MKVSETLSLKETDKGKRTFIKNRESILSGFLAGQPINVIYHDDYVEVVLDDDGPRKVAKGNIIDIQSKRMNKVFPEASRVNVVYQKSRILITAHYSEKRVQQREQRVRNGSELRMGELFAGTGNLALQIKRGLQHAGVKTTHVFSNESDADKAYILANNAELWGDGKGRLMVDDLMTMDLGEFPEVDILVMGYPCVGFSMMQTNKQHRDFRHPNAGALFVRVLDVINRTNPSIIILENSPQMKKSDTLFIMDSVLHATGYKSTETTLKGTDYGDFEPRERMAKIYHSKGLSSFDTSSITPRVNAIRTVADILEPTTVRPSDWKPYNYLRNHANKKSHGHGFFAVTPSETSLKTMGANYSKAQPDSSFLAHENDNELFRMFTPQEHANIRRIDSTVKKAINESAEGGGQFYQRGSRSRAHRVLGDSISPLPWFSAGISVGEWIRANQYIEHNSDIFEFQITA